MLATLVDKKSVPDSDLLILARSPVDCRWDGGSTFTPELEGAMQPWDFDLTEHDDRRYPANTWIERRHVDGFDGELSRS